MENHFTWNWAPTFQISHLLFANFGVQIGLEKMGWKVGISNLGDPKSVAFWALSGGSKSTRWRLLFGCVYRAAKQLFWHFSPPQKHQASLGEALFWRAFASRKTKVVQFWSTAKLHSSLVRRREFSRLLHSTRLGSRRLPRNTRVKMTSKEVIFTRYTSASWGHSRPHEAR